MNQPPWLAVLTHTPWWVFVVFVVLLALGYQQSRDRTVGRKRLLLLPVAMLGLSLHGVASAFGLQWLPALAWALGVVTLAALGARGLKLPAQAGSPTSIQVRGSWSPLALMMAIFFIKYALGYALARNLAVIFQAWFIAAVSLALGSLSGVFLARAGASWCARPTGGSLPDLASGNFQREPSQP